MPTLIRFESLIPLFETATARVISNDGIDVPVGYFSYTDDEQSFVIGTNIDDRPDILIALSAEVERVSLHEVKIPGGLLYFVKPVDLTGLK